MATIIRSWRLFGLLAAAITTAMCLGLPYADFRSVRGTEFIVVHAVLCALPCLLVAFTASSLVVLWPSRTTRWILANRRYIGLAFAFGMGWHFVFVAYFMASFGNRLRWFDFMVDIVGACFLLAMTLTSFRQFSRRLSPANWRRLHKTGIYTLWLLPTYFFLDDYVESRQPYYFALFVVLLAAVSLRIFAWKWRSPVVRGAA
jgi:methionine sulfoxide reductase heme-binding subunit